MSKPDTPARWLRGVLTVLVGSLFALSFWENWAALDHAAVQGGVPHPGPWPWMVDGFILAMALMAVLASMERRSVWWPRTGMAGSTALSLAVVVSHAPAAHGGQWLAAWSPAAVLFSFECLLWLVFGAPRPGLAHAPVTAVRERVSAPLAVHAVPPEREAVVPLLTPAERERIRRRLHKGLDAATITAETGIDARAVQACVDKLTQSNGHKAGTP